MTDHELVTRARGLASRLIAEATMAEIEAARDTRTLGDTLTRAGFRSEATAVAIEHALRQRYAGELATLARWARNHPEALSIVELDEDRHTLRALARGLAAAVAPEQRLAGAVVTRRLPEAMLAELAHAPGVVQIGKLLARGRHPLADAFAGKTTLDVFEVEHALTKSFVAHVVVDDHAALVHLAQLVDTENLTTALLLSARGRGLDAARYFVTPGDRLDETTFVAAAAATPDLCREILARAFMRTPLAVALYASSPSAIEDAALSWQLSTQAQARRIEPHGLAAVIHFVLRARLEARRLRRVAWRLMFGGAA